MGNERRVVGGFRWNIDESLDDDGVHSYEKNDFKDFLKRINELTVRFDGGSGCSSLICNNRLSVSNLSIRFHKRLTNDSCSFSNVFSNSIFSRFN